MSMLIDGMGEVPEAVMRVAVAAPVSVRVMVIGVISSADKVGPIFMVGLVKVGISI